MIASQYCLPCELVVSIAIAATVWIAGFFVFYLRKAVKARHFFSPNRIFAGKIGRRSQTNLTIGFLRDLIKWAEMLMGELEDARRVLERKGISHGMALLCSHRLFVFRHISSSINLGGGGHSLFIVLSAVLQFSALK